MSFLNNLLGNATEVNLHEIKTQFNPILFEGETLISAYKIFRDKWVFTNKRLIMQDIQGFTGSKQEFHSIPYKSITHFSIETAGTFDDDCEMKIWLVGSKDPLVKEFSRDIDIKGLSKTLAALVLNAK